jgi:hypothetical protein
LPKWRRIITIVKYFSLFKVRIRSNPDSREFSMPARKYTCDLLPVLVLLCCSLASCSRIITGTVIKPAIGNLQQETDIELVCDGAPAYLLMLDSMLVSSPDNSELLIIASQSYSAYVPTLTECGGSASRLAAMAEKANLYGQKLLLPLLPAGRGTDSATFDRRLASLGKSDVPAVFWGATGWLTWILRQNNSPEAVADIVFIEKIMARLLELNESYQGGSIHLFFGAYYAAKPEMLGGNMQKSAEHFERALAISDRRFLLTQVTYAEKLARMTMNSELHDSLLREVLEFPLAKAPEFALSNQLAKKRAEKLLAENYFAE